jgi:hypothetical protein
MSKVRFLKFKVTNDAAGASAKVSYSLDNRTDGRKCVTIYAKEYGRELSKVFVDEPVQNDTDTMTDYFCKDTVRLFEDHPMYAEARACVERFKQEQDAKFDKKYGRVSTPVVESVTAGGGVYSDLLVRLGVKSVILL